MGGLKADPSLGDFGGRPEGRPFSGRLRWEAWRQTLLWETSVEGLKADPSLGDFGGRPEGRPFSGRLRWKA